MPVIGAASAESCLPCSPGTSQSTAGTDRPCDECPPGTFADQLNATGCTDCPAGRFCPNAGTIQPLDCAAGEYQNLTGQAACMQCPAGEFQAERGQTACDTCAAGGYCNTPRTAAAASRPALRGATTRRWAAAHPTPVSSAPPVPLARSPAQSAARRARAAVLGHLAASPG